MAGGRTFVIRLIGDTKSAQAGFARVTGSALRFAAAFAATQIVLGAVSRAVSKSVQAALEFDRSLLKLTTQIGITREAAEEAGKSIMNMTNVGVGAQELVDAMFFIQSAGLRGADAFDALEASAKGAAIGLGETKVVADLVTSAMNAYGPAVMSASRATDVIIAAVKEGKAEAQELAASMGGILPVASAMGVEFHEAAGMIAAMTRTGTDAATATTQLRSIMMTLLKPTKATSDALEGMGLSAEELRATIMEDGLFAALMSIHDASGGASDALAEVFRNQRALLGVQDLLGPSMQTNADILRRMAEEARLTDQAFAEFSTSAPGAVSRLGVEVEALRLKMASGSGASDAYRSGVEIMTVAVQRASHAVSDEASRIEMRNRAYSAASDALGRARKMTEGLTGAELAAVQSSAAYQANIAVVNQELRQFASAGMGASVRIRDLNDITDNGANVTNRLTDALNGYVTLTDQRLEGNTELWSSLGRTYGNVATDGDTLAGVQDILAEQMWDQVAAIQAVRDETMRLIDPMYNLVRADEEATASRENYLQVMANEASTVDDVRDAVLDYTKKYAELDAAVGISGEVMDAFVSGPLADMERNALISGEAFDKTAESLQDVIKRHDALSGRKTESQHTVNITYVQTNMPPVSDVPGMAAGGPVKANKLYVVGEEGPELFAASSSGRIIPNNETMAFLNEQPQSRQVNFDLDGGSGSDVVVEQGAIRVEVTINGSASAREVGGAVRDTMEDALERLVRELAVS
jgi:hypothetical protein